MRFPASIILSTTNHLLQCDFFDDVYSFLWKSFLVSIFYQLTSEKNQVYTGNLRHCGQTLLLIKFYLIRNHEGQQRKLASTIQVSLLTFSLMFFYHMVKLIASFISLSSVHLFVCFSNNLNHCYQQMPGAYKMCTAVINT